MAGSESMSSARRPSRPSSKTWKSPTGPAPTMTASVTVASLVRSGDKGFLQQGGGVSKGFRGQRRGEPLLSDPFRVEQAGLIFRAAIAKHGDDHVTGPQLPRD